MALTRVELSPDVFIVCATHALTTESEEVMGLLLGDVHYGSNGEAVAHISVAMPQIRTDRRKDRVEASPEQLASAMAVAERLSEGSQTEVRVIGWYHSHPHITVLPSHVDVRTQGSYQMLDQGFVGIILSTFNQDTAECTQQIQVTAFQSVQQTQHSLSPTNSYGVDSPMAKALAASAADARQNLAAGGQWVRREVPLTVGAELATPGRQPDGLRTLLEVLFEEERQAFTDAISAAADEHGRVDPLTAMHHAGVYQQHLCRLMEVVAGPVLASLRARSAQASLQLEQLQQMKAAILSAQAQGNTEGRKAQPNVQISYMDLAHAPTAAAPSTATSAPKPDPETSATAQSSSAPSNGAVPSNGSESHVWPTDGHSSSAAPGTVGVAWPPASSSWEQDARAEQQRAASAWNGGGHDPYDAGIVTISHPSTATYQNGAVKGAAIAPDFAQGAESANAWSTVGQQDGIPSAQQQPKLIPTQATHRYTPQLMSHPLPDQAASEASPTSHSASASPAKIRIKSSRQPAAGGGGNCGGRADGYSSAGEAGVAAAAAAADKGKHKKNLWHRSTDPFAGLLTEALPNKLSLRGGRKKSPEAAAHGR